MSNRQIFETGLALGGAALGAAGAVLIEPFVIGVGVVAAGVGAAMRYSDQRLQESAKQQEPCHASSVK